MRLRILVLLWALPLATEAAKQDVDFAKYEVPLYDQIVNRIRAKHRSATWQRPSKTRTVFHDSVCL